MPAALLESAPLPSSATSLGESIARVETALTAYAEQPSDPVVAQTLRAARRGVAAALDPNDDSPGTAPDVVRLRALVRSVAASGALDLPVVTGDLALAEATARRGGAGLLGAMLLAPAWQWPGAPKLSQVPAWLLADYVAWIFAAPQGFTTPGQAALYPVRFLHWMEELVRYTLARPGAVATHEALAAFLQHGNCIPLYFCAGSLRRHYEVRARLLQCAAVRPAVAMAAPPRAGRRLRVGFINRHFGPQTETYTTLPMFERLDPERFEVLLFALRATDTPLEAHARRHAAEFNLLPDDAGAQVDRLRAAKLDVAVFGTNVTAVFQRGRADRVAPRGAVAGGEQFLLHHDRPARN